VTTVSASIGSGKDNEGVVATKGSTLVAIVRDAGVVVGVESGVAEGDGVEATLEPPHALRAATKTSAASADQTDLPSDKCNASIRAARLVLTWANPQGRESNALRQRWYRAISRGGTAAAV
jgi:hypothetical protein